MKDDQQPAFPRLERAGADAHDGMTLRDYFAAKAMQAFLTRDSLTDLPKEKLSKFAYSMSDAMMEARK
jgi:hypothetical protein